MPDSMKVELVSIEQAIWSGEATFVRAKTVEGEIGILPGHSPLLGQLEDGQPVRIDPVSGSSITVNVEGGFLSVRPDGVSVLAESAEVVSGSASDSVERP
jgi:F-type H+-transporting ATPase subunit epsilon